MKPVSSHSVATDLWSDWLLHERYADDPDFAKEIYQTVEKFTDRVLDFAQLNATAHLLDVGAGEGALGFRAIQKWGPALQVTFTDISAPLLKLARERATDKNVLSQCRFIQASADQLSALDDASFDAVTTRSVLAYVDDKASAFQAFHRALKPGGRISIAEPIMLYSAIESMTLRQRYEENPERLEHRLMHLWASAQFPDTPEKIAQSAITNYSERELMQFALAAGFTDLHLELHIDVAPSVSRSWDVFIGTSPHPLAPSLRRIMNEQFTASERAFFEGLMRPLVESGQRMSTTRMAYLTARKPP